MPSPQDFNYPLLNASLNGVSFVLLVAGYVMIRSGKKRAHIALMVSALVTSTLFLASYLTYHSLTEGVVTKFPTEFPVARKIYLAVLITHIPLAGLLLPMVIITVVPALRQRFDKHKRWARVTLPVWLYVSITGVLIYLMLYRWFVPSEAVAARATLVSAAASQGAALGDKLTFTPSVFRIHANPEDDVVSAQFEVSNAGDAAVRIVELDTSCYCLEVRSDSEEIAAGATVLVEADFSLEKLVGTTEKYVIVRTDDLEQAELRLGVQVTVDPIYSIEPLTLEWKVGEALVPKEIIFKVVREQAIHVTELQATREESFSVALKTVEPGREYRVVLTPKTTQKQLLGYVRVVTDCEIEKYANELMYFKVSRSSALNQERGAGEEQGG
jgi:putative membrane protein